MCVWVATRIDSKPQNHGKKLKKWKQLFDALAFNVKLELIMEK